MTEQTLTQLRAAVDPSYRPPVGEWIRAVRPTGLFVSDHDAEPTVVPAGCVLRVTRWEHGGLRVEQVGRGGGLYRFLDTWPNPDWETFQLADLRPDARVEAKAVAVWSETTITVTASTAQELELAAKRHAVRLALDLAGGEPLGLRAVSDVRPWPKEVDGAFITVVQQDWRMTIGNPDGAA